MASFIILPGFGVEEGEGTHILHTQVGGGGREGGGGLLPTYHPYICYTAIQIHLPILLTRRGREEGGEGEEEGGSLLFNLGRENSLLFLLFWKNFIHASWKHYSGGRRPDSRHYLSHSGLALLLCLTFSYSHISSHILSPGVHGGEEEEREGEEGGRRKTWAGLVHLLSHAFLCHYIMPLF